MNHILYLFFPQPANSCCSHLNLFFLIPALWLILNSPMFWRFTMQNKVVVQNMLGLVSTCSWTFLSARGSKVHVPRRKESRKKNITTKLSLESYRVLFPYIIDLGSCKGLSRLKGKELRHSLSVERFHHQQVKRVYIWEAIYGKFNLYQLLFL